VDDTVDPVAASAATAGSVAARPETVVRKKGEPEPESNGSARDKADKSPSDKADKEASAASPTPSVSDLAPSESAPGSASATPPPASAARLSASRTTSPKWPSPAGEKADSGKAGSEKSGSDKADAGKAGPDNPGSDKANSDKANSDKANSDKANSDKANSDKANSDKAGSGKGDKSPSVTSAAQQDTIVAASPGRATVADKPSDARPAWSGTLSGQASKTTRPDPSPSGTTAASARGSDRPDPAASNAASLAVAALTDSSGSGSGQAPTGYSDYAPTSYSSKDSSSRDSVWSTPSSAAAASSTDSPGPSSGGSATGFTSARSATAGYPPSAEEAAKPSGAGFSPTSSSPTGSPSSSAGARPSSIWTSQDRQDPGLGRPAYSPSGGYGDPARGAAGAVAAAGGAAGVGAAAGAAGAAGPYFADTAQMPGRVVASKAPSADTKPSWSDDLVSKLRSPFGTATKKRKPEQSALPGAAIMGGAAALAVNTKPTSKRSPAPAAPVAQSSRQDGGDVRRDAQLVLSRIEPWSVMKFSFIVALAGWVVLFVAVAALYYALRAFGVFHYLEQTVTTVTSSKGHSGSNAQRWFSASNVLGYTMLAGAINVILFTALATVGSVIYNLVTHLSGGVEVTLREAD
jgi:hypothetical protein